jgi:hypothetical protein
VPKGNLDTLSPEDFRAAWDGLPKADKARVGLIAREWTSGTSFEWQELLNEAIVRGKAGTIIDRFAGDRQLFWVYGRYKYFRGQSDAVGDAYSRYVSAFSSECWLTALVVSLI